MNLIGSLIILYSLDVIENDCVCAALEIEKKS